MTKILIVQRDMKAINRMVSNVGLVDWQNECL